MKFGKSLSNQNEETLPEWRDKFLSYKELKKCVKLIDDPRVGGGGGDISSSAGFAKRQRLGSEDRAKEGISYSYAMSKEEMDFVRLLENELEKFNTFIVEKEEEYIIRLKVPPSLFF